MNLNELNIKPEIIKAVEEMGFDEFTEIQAQAIPFAKEGKDVLGQAQTGTGKTAAFVIPVLEQLDFESDDLQAIMLAPTRELAIQICQEIDKIGKYMNVRAMSVYGGEPIDKQMKLLKNRPQIVVGTPGRCLDLLNRRKLKLNNIEMPKNVNALQYESPELNVVAIAVEAGFSLSNSMLENIGGEKEEIDW